NIRKNLTIAINVAAKQLKQKNFSHQILTLLEKHNISANYIKLELTESALMDDPIDVIRQLKVLRKEGITIAIDDFGTGYSSLSYLKKFPIDYLKIDQSFIRDIGEDKNDEAIIRAIIQMAHSLGQKVIAEGVETQQQLEFLASLDCDYAQGFLFSKPVPWNDAEQFLPVQ
ncbi:MAG: EAL domain-containing protein, partial [Pseudomonadales bacterium]|nr:EAL domain-containing protein [Pseudomonadales bacterium]